MKRLLRGIAVVSVLLVALVAIAWPWIRPMLEARIARTLDVALGDLGTVKVVELSLLPPQLALGQLTVVVEGDVEVRVSRVQGHVVGLGLAGPMIGVDLLEPEVVLHVGEQPTGPELPEVWPPFVRSVRMFGGSLDVRVPHHELRVRLTGLEAGVEVRAGRGDVVATATGRVTRGAKEIGISRVALALRLEGGAVRVREAELVSDAGHLLASGRGSGSGLEGRLELELALERLSELVPDLELAGTLALEGDVRGSLEAPAFEGALEIQDGRIATVDVSGPARLQVRGSSWSLETERLEIFGGSVAGEASGELTAGMPYVVTARPEGWSPSVFLAALDTEIELSGAVDGDARLEGRLLEAEVAGTSDLRWRLGSHVVGGSVEFTVAEGGSGVQATLGIEEGDRVQAEFRFAEDGPVGDVEVRLHDLEAIGLALGVDLAGNDLEGRFEVRPTESGSVVRGSATVEALVLEGRVLGPVRGPFSIADGVLDTDGLEVSAYNTEVRGRIALTSDAENDLRAKVSGASLARLAALAQLPEAGWPAVAGTLFTEIEVLGPWSAPQANARGNLADVSIGGERLGGIYGGALWSEDGWSLRGDLRLPAEATGHVQAHVDHAGRLTAVLEARGWDLDEIPVIRTQRVPLEGALDLSGSFGGTLTHPTGVVALSVARLRFGGRTLPDATIDAELDGESWRGRFALGESVDVIGRGDLGGPLGFDVSGEWRSFEVGGFLLPGSALRFVTSGRGTLRGGAAQPLGSGHLEIDEVRIGQGRAEVRNEAPGRIEIREGQVELDGLALIADRRRVELAFRLGSGSSFLRARGNLDLGLLERVVPTVTSARGRLELDLEATRDDAGRPWITQGRAGLTKGALDLDLLVGIRNLTGAATFDGTDLEIGQLAGSLGGGTIDVRGAIRGLDTWDLDWTFADASFGAPLWLDHVVDGAGRFEGPLARPRIVGRIELERAVYDRDVAWQELLPWFRRQSLAWKPPELPLDVDLELVADGGVFVDNNLASLELAGKFSAKGPAEDLRLQGRLDVLDGSLGLRGRQFDVTAGTVRFREEAPTNPEFELLGEATIRAGDADYEVQLRAHGTAREPRIELGTDDPSLTETDAVALLTFGKTLAQLRSESSSFEVFEVLELTTEPMIGDVGRPIREAIPVDRIEIQPSFSRTTGVTEPRVSVEKEIRPGLRATAGTTLGAGRRQDASLAAQVTPRVGVRGRWESESDSDGGTFGGDVELTHPFWSLRELWEGFGR